MEFRSSLESSRCWLCREGRNWLCRNTKTLFCSYSIFFPFQTIDQFEYDGCDNCDAYLQMKGNREMVYDCTSSSFDG